MATQKYTTLGTGTLASTYTAGATTITLGTGQGASLPSTGLFVVALDNPPAFFLQATSRSGDVVTVGTSAVDGTTAVNKGSGVVVTEVITASVLDGLRADACQTGTFSGAVAEKAGNLFLPSDGHVLMRDTGSAFKWWGPVHPMAADPTAQTWTWVNQGTSTRDDTTGGIYLEATKGAGVQLRCLVKSVPGSTPWKARFGFLPHTNGANTQRVGTLFRESGSGKVSTWYLRCNSGTNNLEYDRWNDASGTGGSAILSGGQVAPYSSLLWLELGDDGTNRTYSYSIDGKHWFQVYSETRTTFITADQIGFFADDESNICAAAITLLSYQEV